MADTPVISKLTSPNGTVYEIKDAKARADIASIQNAITGGVNFIGETTTALTDGSTTGTISVNGNDVTAATGNLAVYGGKEFVFDGTKWIELGDLSLIGDLGWKDSASGSYKPAGTVSQPSFTGTSMTSTGTFQPAGTITIATGSGTANYTPAGTVAAPTISVASAGSTTTVTPIATVGTLPTLTVTVANENMTFSFDQGTLPTKGSDVTVKTGDASYSASAPAFTGTATELTASFSGTSGNVSVTGTPAGTVSQPTFTGTDATITVT